ncbi:MAG TPA: cyclopropane-fatty-acyl-phospholipid synthase family protein [Aestuariivirgaceae bacterium]|nr:cyclopropane-fatty-acyl-phospholipid synthase family protein [Aestuariivirgaceae bacterium]
MFVVLQRMLARLVEHGGLEVVDPDGSVHRFGDGSGAPVRVRFTSQAAAAKIVIHPDLNLGECYMNGGLVIERGSIYDLIHLLLDNLKHRSPPAALRVVHTLRRLTRRLHQYNPVPRARRNVAHHYDLSREIYELFLDRDRQYSCAYFERPEASLEEAQLAKKRHLAAKLMIEPGMRVLDIGSGWGGLGLYLAEVCQAEVVGVTLSTEQHAFSNERARQIGAQGQVEFRLMDYRELGGRFDRIVSVGMFEHVGIGHYPAFFAKVESLLSEDGVALLHSISRSGGPSATSSWIAKYIFPGGYVPALSEVVPVIERSGLYITDVEILRLHYAETLKEWRRRFTAQRDRVTALYDERFFRMWEYYLASSEAAFRLMGMNNFQIQMCHHQQVLPITRTYIGEEEQRLRAIDSPRPHIKSVPAE